jgi:lytic murein transglycosylase
VFFEGELLAALKILQSGDTVAANMQGSWAGAMGHTQFMPSSFLAYAVDFNGDGKRNIWGDDPTDALASAAAYLAGYGWTKGALWGVEITLPDGFDYDQTSERVKKPVADWQALGVRRADGGDLPDHGVASVLLPGGARGAAFLIFSNFQVIERYNTADAYVIAVGHLADLLKGGTRIKSDWPRDLRALTLDERLDLQTRLTRAGFDTLGIDGKMGPNTIAAVKSFQKSKGIVPDGYPSLDVLNKLE